MNKKVLETERKYFEDVKALTQEIIDENTSRIQEIEKENQELRLHMLDNIELDMDLGDVDISGIVLGERMRINAEVEADSIKQNQRLEKVKHTPFFAKIAIQDDEVENFYIGLQNIKKGTKLFVVDWRAPICTLYYYGKLGPAHYTVNQRKIKTNLTLKRQFEIEDCQISSYFDADEKVNDNLLLNILSQKTSTYMQNIVKSIQAEQNKVIRENLNQNIVVQGVAGSGKTSIAMHRIAYLLYDNKNLTSENILFVSPNKLFTKYVSRLLPELGEDNVPCFTIHEVLNSFRLTKLTVETRSQMLEELQFHTKRKIDFEAKFGVEYLNKISQFLTNLLSKETIYKIFEPVIPLTDEALDKIYYEGETPYLAYNRFETIMQRFCDYYALKKTRSERLKARLLTSYRKFFEAENLYEEFMKKERLSSNTCHFDNLPTKLLFDISINGFTHDTDIQHIVVDEMQDYDLVSFTLLKILYPKATFTILGDTNQNIITPKNNLDDISTLFDAKEIHLEISYRSTKNIMDFANNILGIKSTTSSLRTGEDVKVANFDTIQNLAEKINAEMDFSVKNKEKTAIITFDKNLAETLAIKLENASPFFDDNAQVLDSEIIITSPFMAKGLEFDKVMIVKDKNFDSSSTLGKKMLYISLTRALHKAIILEENN